MIDDALAGRLPFASSCGGNSRRTSARIIVRLLPPLLQQGEYGPVNETVDDFTAETGSPRNSAPLSCDALFQIVSQYR